MRRKHHSSVSKFTERVSSAGLNFITVILKSHNIDEGHFLIIIKALRSMSPIGGSMPLCCILDASTLMHKKREKSFSDNLLSISLLVFCRAGL